MARLLPHTSHSSAYHTNPKNLITLETIWSKTCIRNFTVYILDWLPIVEAEVADQGSRNG